MTQKFTKNIPYNDTPIPCYIIYSHVHIAKHNQLDWKATIFCCDCDSKIWIIKVFLLKKLNKTKIWTVEVFIFFGKNRHSQQTHA